MTGTVSLERRLAALAVHALTATGVVWAFLALVAAAESDWAAMFLWLAVALLVDAIDGPLARKVAVSEALPEWNGEILDLVVDYLTYAFIPAYAALVAGLFPEGFGIVGAAIICLTAAGFFAKRHQKSADNYFIGFPAIWNLILFYWMVFAVTPEVVLATTVAFGVMTFLPIRFVHPMRVVRFRSASLVVVGLAAAMAILAIVQDLSPGGWIRAGLALALVYLFGVSLWRTFRGPDD